MLWIYMIDILYVHMFVCKDWGGGVRRLGMLLILSFQANFQVTTNI